MKLINLTPATVKLDRKKKKVSKHLFYTTIGLVLFTFGFKSHMTTVETEIMELKQTINDTKSLKAQSSSLQLNIEKIEEMDNLLSKDSFPYHRFLYFLNTNATPDMKIISVQNKLLEPLDDLTEVSAPDSPNGETVPPVEGELPSPVPGEEGVNTTEQTVLENKAASELQLASKLFDASVLYIRGYSVYPDSIAILSEKMRKEDYVDQVKVTKVDNYDTGIQSFKLFELEVTFY